MDLPFETTIRVRFAELDPYGHVNHAMYLTYLEQGRTDALEAIGLSMSTVAAEGFQFVVTDVSAQFLAPATTAEPIVVRTTIEDLRRVSGIWVQQITSPDGETLFLTARVRAGVTNREGRPARPPTWINDGLQRLVEPAGANDT